MKNSADLGGCYPHRPSASVDNTLLYLQNSSYPTQPHSIIAKYLFPKTHSVPRAMLSEICSLLVTDNVHGQIFEYVLIDW